MYPDEKTVEIRLKHIEQELPVLIKEKESLDRNIELLEEEKKLIMQLNHVRNLEKNK